MRVLLMLFAIISVAGCTAGYHRDAARDDTKDRISVGTVQREIRVGMSGADVISALGAPNMVTTDAQRRETWVYDKIATERVYSGSSTSGGAGGFGGGGGGGPVGGAGGQGFVTIEWIGGAA